jgi:hypothetical protein
MQRLPPFSAVITAAFLLLHGPGAWGADDQAKPCGDTPGAAVAAAEKALASKEEGAERASLLCLIAAVKFLEASQPIVTDGPDRHELLRVPQTGKPGKP